MLQSPCILQFKKQEQSDSATFQNALPIQHEPAVQHQQHLLPSARLLWTTKHRHWLELLRPALHSLHQPGLHSNVSKFHHHPATTAIFVECTMTQAVRKHTSQQPTKDSWQRPQCLLTHCPWISKLLPIPSHWQMSISVTTPLPFPRTAEKNTTPFWLAPPSRSHSHPTNTMSELNKSTDEHPPSLPTAQLLLCDCCCCHDGVSFCSFNCVACQIMDVVNYVGYLDAASTLLLVCILLKK